MSKEIDVRITDAMEACEKAERLLDSIYHGYEFAVLRSMNRAIVSGRAAVASKDGIIRQTYTVKPAEIRKATSLKKARVDDLEASVTFQGSMLPISRFKVKPTKDTTGKKRKQPRVQVRKDAGLKPLGHFVYRGTVFSRLGDTRLPVETKTGPAVPLMAGTEAVRGEIESVMSETFLKRLEHETDQILKNGEGSLGRKR